VVTRRLALTAPSILKYPTETATSTNGQFGNFTEGNYTFSASSYIEGTSPTFLGRLFDGVDPSSVGGGTALLKYVAGTGQIMGNSSYIVGDYFGEWIKVKMPTAIWLDYVKTYMRAVLPPRAPSDYRVYGSNDDSAWDLLIDTVGAAYAADPSFGGSKVHKSAKVKPANKYKYYAFVVNKLAGGADSTTLNFEELEFYGSEEKWCEEACLAGQEYGACDDNSTSTLPTCKQVRGAYHPPLRRVLRIPRVVVPVGSLQGRCGG
jgi:hypothetical protein